jgi:hypothetical protein
MGRPVTTGHRVGALVRGNLARLDRGTRRRVAELTSAFAAAPLESVRDHLIAGLARKTLLAQRAEAGLLAAADLGKCVGGLGKFATSIWGALRRDAELLLLIEQQGIAKPAAITCSRCGARVAATDYLQHACVRPPAADADAQPAAQIAADAPARSDSGTADSTEPGA